MIKKLLAFVFSLTIIGCSDGSSYIDDVYLVERIAESDTLCVNVQCRIKYLNVEENKVGIAFVHSAIFKGEKIYQKCQYKVDEKDEKTEVCDVYVYSHKPSGFTKTVNNVEIK